ncbi:MAG: hypothetical protein ACRET4_12375 [Steroidobacteraceae bacterium]
MNCRYPFLAAALAAFLLGSCTFVSRAYGIEIRTDGVHAMSPARPSVALRTANH